MTWRLPHGHDAHRISRPRPWRWLALAGLIVAVLLNSGCILTSPGQWIHNGFKVGPNYCRPPAPVAAEWIQANDPSVQNHHLQDWWQVFEDPTLDALIVTAYEQNPNLRVAGTRVLQARAGQAIAVGNIFPQTQQATGSYSRSTSTPTCPSSARFSTCSHLLTLGRVLQLVLRLQPELGARPVGPYPQEHRVDQRQPGRFGGELRRSPGDPAGRRGHELRAVSGRPAADQDRARQRPDPGGSPGPHRGAIPGRHRRPGSTWSKRGPSWSRPARPSPSLQIALGQANDTLCILLGMPPRDLEPELGPGPDLGSAPMPNTPAWVATGIPADLLRRRPDVRSAERQVAAQSAQIGVAEAALYPTIAINGILGWDAADLTKLFETKSFIGSIIPSFSWNILNYGRIRNNVRLQDGQDAGADCDLPEHGPGGRPGSPDSSPGLLEISGTGRGT